MRPPIIPHPIIHKQHLGLNLHQPLQHRMHPCIRAHARPHNTNTRRRQRRDNRISRVPEEPRDAVPWPQREVLEGENAAADALAEIGPAYGVRGGLVGFDDGGVGGGGVAGGVEEVFGEVEGGGGEEVGAGVHGGVGGEDLGGC